MTEDVVLCGHPSCIAAFERDLEIEAARQRVEETRLQVEEARARLAAADREVEEAAAELARLEGEQAHWRWVMRERAQGA